jgi:ribulose-phosphate 3-epimerase
MKNLKKINLTASIICADHLNLESEIKIMEDAGIDYIHVDVMDGHFVPRLGIYPEVIEAVRKISTLPMDAHLMINNPDEFIPLFAKSGADIITVPAEGNNHLHRTIKLIKDLGRVAGVAINLATSLNVLDYIMDDIGLILIMAINPGIVGHKLIPASLKKTQDLAAKVANYPNMIIEVDGGVTFESAKLMAEAGANMLVCGSSTIYKKTDSVKINVEKMRSLLK